MVIAMYICIDDNLIAVNAYIHGNNHNACGYSYCHVYIYMAITVMQLRLLPCIYALRGLAPLYCHKWV